MLRPIRRHVTFATNYHFPRPSGATRAVPVVRTRVVRVASVGVMLYVLIRPELMEVIRGVMGPHRSRLREILFVNRISACRLRNGNVRFVYLLLHTVRSHLMGKDCLTVLRRAIRKTVQVRDQGVRMERCSRHYHRSPRVVMLVNEAVLASTSNAVFYYERERYFSWAGVHAGCRSLPRTRAMVTRYRDLRPPRVLCRGVREVMVVTFSIIRNGRKFSNVLLSHRTCLRVVSVVGVVTREVMGKESRMVLLVSFASVRQCVRAYRYFIFPMFRCEFWDEVPPAHFRYPRASGKRR